MDMIMTEAQINLFTDELRKEEKSRATIEKYGRDLKKLLYFLDGAPLSKEAMVRYKEHLMRERYAVSSINSFLVAANRFCIFLNRSDCIVKTFRQQRPVCESCGRHLTQAEYERLVRTAKRQGKDRLAMVLQAVGSTGMRVSELQFLTVEALEKGKIVIHCKGKVRTVLLPGTLQKALRIYIKKKNIQCGVIFCTSGGRPLDRSNIWREMKALCRAANVDESKVFPHNLRHLFARCFYKIKKDIARLADILGHSSVETTRIYIRTTAGEHLRQLEGMGLVLTE